MYQHGKVKKNNKKRRRIVRLIIFVVFAIVCIIASKVIHNALKPQVTITQSRAVTTHVTYQAKNKHYDEGDFGIDLPGDWQLIPRPVGPYKSFTWQASDSGTDGQSIAIYEDVIPAHFAVNKVVIVNGELDHVIVNGTASDNCSKYTIGTSTTGGQVGSPARWQGIDFLCDQSNLQRDIIGTSSTDGINTVILKSSSTGQTHKFFFTYTNENNANPDYTPFYNALNSFKMQ